ncbi:netrin receptor [Culex quinquefasciatus]|uniref:Netrin receptor n=1 Tax=Culex quinquefasciatus TaxID=7176 RepID=B0WY72_CULQU|nr:netrin receptor [Culex quinquefasciatus]|eukprot:XP_001862344.1 netrin receptor [Culex quinquefasciatus]
MAHIKRQISISPRSVRVELGGRAEIICNVNATPVAKIAWHKNGAPLVPNPPVVITVEDKVLLAHVTMQDMANYTCVAENIAGKRVSEPVSLTVYEPCPVLSNHCALITFVTGRWLWNSACRLPARKC